MLGGRQIEVKFISTTLPTDVFGGDSSNKNDEDLSNDEAKQFQSMIYNLMVRLTGWERYLLQFNFPMYYWPFMIILYSAT